MVLGNALNTIGLGLRTFLAGVADSPGPIRLAIGLGCVIAVAPHIIARSGHYPAMHRSGCARHYHDAQPPLAEATRLSSPARYRTLTASTLLLLSVC